MTKDEARAVFAEEIARIAPEIDLAEVDPAADLRDELQIDSMDFLNLVTALSQRLGIAIPESDYPEFSSIDHAVAYIASTAS